MTFKIKLAIFSNTEEDHKRVYGENYDSEKNYPKYSGQMQVPESELPKFIEYLQKAKPDHNEYLGEPAVPIKVSGWLSTSNKGTKYQGLTFEPVFKKQKEIEDGTNQADPKDFKLTEKKQDEEFPF